MSQTSEDEYAQRGEDYGLRNRCLMLKNGVSQTTSQIHVEDCDNLGGVVCERPSSSKLYLGIDYVLCCV